MATGTAVHFRWFVEDGVAIVEILSRELNQPAFAEELRGQLGRVLASRPAPVMLLDFGKTRYMSSSAFAVLVELARATQQAGVLLATCGMTPELLVGAQILSLDQVVPMYGDQATALVALHAVGVEHG